MATRKFYGELRRGHRVGFTLVELIVATGGMVIVMGFAYRMFDTTRASAIKMTRRQSAINYSVAVIDEVSGLVRDAISPENLDLDDALIVKGIFGSDRLSVCTYLRGAAEGLYIVSVGPAEGDEEGIYYQWHERPVASATGTEPVGEALRTLGGIRIESEPQLRFRYALEVEPGAAVNYVDELEGDQWPAIVEVTVRVELEDDPERPVVLRTSLIPGRVAKTPVVRPEPPTSLSTPPASPPESPQAAPQAVQDETEPEPEQASPPEPVVDTDDGAAPRAAVSPATRAAAPREEAS